MDGEQEQNEPEGDLQPGLPEQESGGEPVTESPHQAPPQNDEASYFRQEAQRNSERAARLEQELQALRQQQQQPQQQYDPRAEQEYLNQLDPEQRAQYYFDRSQQQSNQRFLESQIHTHDQLDQIRFENYLDRNPQHEKLKSEVEATYRQMLAITTRAGYPAQATRERALAQVLFEKNKAEAPKARRAAERQADANRQRQTTKPASMASTVARSSSSQSEESAYDAAIRRLMEAGLVE